MGLGQSIGGLRNSNKRKRTWYNENTVLLFVHHIPAAERLPEVDGLGPAAIDWQRVAHKAPGGVAQILRGVHEHAVVGVKAAVGVAALVRAAATFGLLFCIGRRRGV
jgi:hypothetical protein